MDFAYQDPLPRGPDTTTYRLLSREHVALSDFEGEPVLKVAGKALTLLADRALRDVNFLLRPRHQAKLGRILNDPEASDNDRFVARALLRNAVISAERQLPFCQDTGTAVVFARKGQHVWTDGNDAEALSRGIFRAYREENFRYSQVVPLSMYEEQNSGSNLPAQIDISAVPGETYEFLFLAKGGGSANKSQLFQMSKSVLNPSTLREFLTARMAEIGTAGCPPYHLAAVVGGTSAEYTMKVVKLASAGYLDTLPTSGNAGGRAFRDPEMEEYLMEASRHVGLGAQFGGKYFCHDVRVIRLPRHGASCPIGIGVSCAADRNVLGRIDRDGIWLECLELEPGRFLSVAEQEAPGVRINVDHPMDELRAELGKHPVRTRLLLTGTLVVARDMAHARIREMLEAGEPMPRYLRDHPVYYAGPAKTPQGMPTGSFGPTTAQRMDPYVELFQQHGGSLVMIAKGNRSPSVAASCKRHGGFYLGSVGGPAALLAKEHIRHQEVIDFPEFGMEAVWRIEVEDFPVFVLTDDRGNDFFQQLQGVD